ncbi:MAG: hypothetical protein IPM20_05190 [Gammaproteobacteria bacterium]|nr:hypothetical protein [Gammaproteobacteria bacterium]
MDKSEFYFDKLESILDKEQVELLQTRREHHSGWGSHILTLSTAAVGFSFTFLPLSGFSVFWLALVGILAFVSSIVFSTFGFLVSDKGLESASESHLARRLQHDRVRHRVTRLKREMEELKPDDLKNINAARYQCWRDVEKIYAERNPAKEVEDLNRINMKVNFLNRARTYSFLIGVATITMFSFCNIDAFAN